MQERAGDLDVHYRHDLNAGACQIVTQRGSRFFIASPAMLIPSGPTEHRIRPEGMHEDAIPSVACAEGQISSSQTGLRLYSMVPKRRPQWPLPRARPPRSAGGPTS